MTGQQSDLEDQQNKRLSWRWLCSEKLLRALFDHVRNFLTASFLMLLGLFVHGKEQHYIQSFNFAGTSFILLAALLLLLNLADGIRQLNRLKYDKILIVLLTTVYLFLSFRLVLIAVDFRSALLN